MTAQVLTCSCASRGLAAKGGQAWAKVRVGGRSILGMCGEAYLGCVAKYTWDVWQSSAKPSLLGKLD